MCFCDEVCFFHGDCCYDIEEIGCNSTLNSCAQAGFTDGCCVDEPNCFGASGNCFCDEHCYEQEDCCEDILDIGCLGIYIY